MTESERKAAFRAIPILSEYLATALQDLQFSEMDEACSDSREERDTGTIYDCPPETFQRALVDCAIFSGAMQRHIEAAQEWFTVDQIGYYFYMVRVGHGVSFTDDFDNPATQGLEKAASAMRSEGLYFGDNGLVYWS